MVLSLGFGALASARADASLDHARAARARLGSGVWSRIVRIENTAKRSHYPRELHALVFEVGGLLWFYSDGDGTQSFSTHYHQLAAEKADFAPLLRAIDPGFTHFALVADDPTAPPPSRAQLPNGCFINSYAALRDLLARGELIASARLLLVYYRIGGSLRGHTVLAYDTPGGSYVMDPTAPDNTAQPVPAARAKDAVAVAQEARPELAIARARWVPTELPRSTPLLAALTPASAPTP